ncbi:acid protease, partial [Rhizodiscina lignyota]
TISAPISFDPAQNWEGIDGSWNTFTVQVGTPPQTVRLQISTASQQTWVIAPRGCEGISDSNCPDERGGIYYSNESSTWISEGRFLLWTELNLGYEGDADYGFDVVTLGGQGQGGPTLKNMTIGGLGAEDFWFGHFGVNPKPTNFTSFNEPSPSYISTLKQDKMIPSLTFGYTAGAQYRFTEVLASLTLGGYDSSRFIPNDLSFNFAPNNERDLVVAIQKIAGANSTWSDDDLLPSAIYAYVDSTVPQIWLPLEACQSFEMAFGLTYDNDTDLYLVNQDLHNSLTKSNPNVTFTLGQGFSGGPTVNITLPYAAFDMQATPPYQGLIAQSYYFPLRRATNDTQYTLGRTFLQEAYLFVDWERETFNVSQCAWVEDMTEHLVAVRSPNETVGDDGSGSSSSASSGGSSGSSGLGTGAIVGIAVGIGAAVAILVIGLFFFIRRRRKAAKGHSDDHEKLETPEPDPTSAEPSNRASRRASRENNVIPKAELDATQQPLKVETGSMHKRPLAPVEADSKPREIFEMMGDMPARQEAGGRQLGVKEAMQVREARYNGTDPQANTPTTPVS